MTSLSFIKARSQSAHKESAAALRRILFFVTLLFGFSFSHAHAAAGLDYLSAQQNPDGSFGNTTASLATPVQTTTEALRAYQALGQQTPSINVPALGYLNSDTEANTEFLARKILVNVPAGGNVTALVNALVAHQNIDGGFGDNSGQSSSVFDTAFALQALAAAGYSSSQQVAGAVGFLMNRQTAGGGWADGGNAESAHLTALAMRALWFSRYTYIGVQDALTRAQTFMLSQRDAAGLWGETFDSALSLIALVPYLPDLAPVTGSIASLRAGQSANGSWNNDPYTTALALRAISLADAPQSNPDYVTIQGKVLDAQTGLPLSGVTVTLAGSVSMTVMTISDGVFLFRSLPAGSYTVQLSLASYGTLSTVTSGQLGQTLDLGSLSLAKSLGTTTGTIQGVVTDVATGAPLAGVMVTATGVTTSVLTSANGSYQISNAPAGAITVTATRAGYSPASAAGTLSADGILNFSPALSSGFELSLYLKGTVTSAATGAPLPGVLISVISSTSTVAQAATDAQGNYQIILQSGTVTASLSGYDSVSANIAAVGQTVNFSPRLYTQGTSLPDANTATITGTVLDAGTNQPLSTVTIMATDGVTTKTLVSNSQGQFSLSGIATSQTHLAFSLAGYVSSAINVVLGPLENFNLGQVRLRKETITQFLPDLAVTAINRAQAPTDPKTLLVTGTLSADVANVGTVAAPVGITVLAFYDTNKNNIFDAGDVTLGSVTTPAEIAAGATLPLVIPVQGALPFRDAPIHVWVDSTQEIVESNETNNVGDTTGACQVTSPPVMVNIAPIYGVVSAVSVWPAGMAPSVDGWNAGRFASSGNPAWLVVDLQRSFNVSAIILTSIRWSPGMPYYGYTNIYNLYESADGVTWIPIASGTLYESEDPLKYSNIIPLPVSESTLRYVKYEVVGGSHWAHLVQMDIQALQDPPQTPNIDFTAASLRIIDNGTGQPLSLSLRVGNSGTAPSPSAVKTAFYQGAPAVGGVLLGTVTLPVIAAAGYQDVRLDNVNLNGSDDVYAVVDSTSLVVECSETNNVDHTAVAAATSLGRITVSTDNLVYGPNATAQIVPVVWNIGALPGSYNTVLQIEDTNGVVVTALPAGTAGPVNGGGMLSMPSTWNVGTTLTGNYRVHAFLYAPSGGLLDQATANFTIGQPGTAGTIVSLRVTTDRPIYYTTDTVSIDSLVANLSVSNLIGSSNLRITVSDPSGQVIFTNSGILGQLLPNSLRQLNFPYAFSGAAAAVYRVHGELLDGTSTLLATADTQFEVRFDLAKALNGKVAAALPSLEIGAAQTCTDTLANQGTVTASGIEVHHALLNLDTQQLVNDQILTLTLAPGESNQAERSLATGSFTAGHYACALMVRIGNELKTMAFAPFVVKAPPISIDASLDLGTKGRLLVLLDNGRRGEDDDDAGDDHKNDKPGCDGVKQLSLSASFGAPLSNAAIVTARVSGRDGAFVDAESASLVGFPGVLNLSAGSNGADLVISKLTAQDIELTLQSVGGAQKLGEEYSVEVTAQGGNTLRLASGTIHTDCGTPLHQDQALGNFTLSSLDVIPAANEASYRDTDPHGPATAPGLKAQRALLEALLKAKGWSYTITDTAEDFTREFRTSGYTVYAVFAEQEKLAEPVQKELREAVFRGEGLLVAGIHDARNQKLLDALGIKLIGAVQANGVDLTTSPIGLAGHIDLITGDKALRMKRVHADTAGIYTVIAPQAHTDQDDCHDQGIRYDTETGSGNNDGKDHQDDDECEGHPDRYLDAITTNVYGKGQSVFAGFDLLAIAARDGQNSLAATLLTKALELVHAAELLRGPGAVVPLTLTLTNRGIATPATATISLPVGTTIVDPGTGTAGANALVFNVNLAVGAQQHLTFWVKLPQPSDPVFFQAIITAPSLTQPAATVSYTVTVQQPDSLNSIDDRLTQLINAGATNTSALRRAEGYVAKGLKNFFPQLAIADLLKATDALLGINDPAVTDIRVAIDIWIRWAAQYAD